MRNPPVNIGALVVQLIVYPIGLLWARVMPTKQFNTFGLKWTLNPGPFNVKGECPIYHILLFRLLIPFTEHTLIIVMANATFAGEYISCMTYPWA